jgi:parvulin-like peptidyl-prolyl isomerase
VVLRVGSAQVTESEIDTFAAGLGPRARAIIANQGLRPVGEEYVKTLLLLRRALDDHLDQSPAVRAQLELLREQVLAQAEYQKMANDVMPSPEEVSQYFAAHKSEFDSVQVREFLIRKRPQGSQDPKAGLTAEEAKAKAEAVRKALLAGTDIEKVAQDFTTPASDVMLIDRKPRTFRPDQMMPALAKATLAVKDAGVAEPVETPQAFIVVKVYGYQHPELKEVTTEIEGKLQREKLGAALDDLRKKAEVWMDEGFFSAKPVKPASAIPPPALAPAPAPKP